MILTINIINSKNKNDKKLLGVCNIEYLSSNNFTNEDIKKEYMKYLPLEFNKMKSANKKFNASDLLEKVTEIIQSNYNNFIITNVNDNEMLSNQKNSINFELS